MGWSSCASWHHPITCEALGVQGGRPPSSPVTPLGPARISTPGRDPPPLALLAQAGSEALRSVLLDLSHPTGSKGQGPGPCQSLSLALDFQPPNLGTLSPDLRGRGLIGTLMARGQRGFWEASGAPRGFWESLSISQSLTWEAACNIPRSQLWGYTGEGGQSMWQRRGLSTLRGGSRDPV